MRYAGSSENVKIDGCFELVTLGGTVEKGNCHLHLSVSDERGNMLGGHMFEGCIVRTTMELVIGELKNLMFSRKFCELSDPKYFS